MMNCYIVMCVCCESVCEFVEMMVFVMLLVYDIKYVENVWILSVVMLLNMLMRNVFNVGGIFYGGVEVFGDEWSFGYCLEGLGVY